MNAHFKTQKEGETRVPYGKFGPSKTKISMFVLFLVYRLFYVYIGIDKQHAYSKRDVRALVGDSSLRKSIHLPKASLGQCLSLALETNGKL